MSDALLTVQNTEQRKLTRPWMCFQVACSVAGAVPGPRQAQSVHHAQAHLLPPVQAVVLGEL